MDAHVQGHEPDQHDGQLGRPGSRNQIRQLAGMRGLMAHPKGEILERPIKANFMEGLSVLEYFISPTVPARAARTRRSRTADSGYLTRRLVDVAQDVIIREHDCGTSEAISMPPSRAEGLNNSHPRPHARRGRPQAARQRQAGEDRPCARRATRSRVRLLRRSSRRSRGAAETTTSPVRSVLKCRSQFGVCQACYGTFLATGSMCEIGDAVGIIAAQSIGEPGTS